MYHYAGNNPVHYIDPDGNAYTFKVATDEYWFSSDLSVLDSSFDSIVGLIPYSSVSRKLSNATSDLNRIGENSNLEVVKSTGNDFVLSVLDSAENKCLKSITKALNRMNLFATVYETCKKLLDYETVGREQFIEQFF